jgi:hypothetical protein
MHAPFREQLGNIGHSQAKAEIPADSQGNDVGREQNPTEPCAVLVGGHLLRPPGRTLYQERG